MNGELVWHGIWICSGIVSMGFLPLLALSFSFFFSIELLEVGSWMVALMDMAVEIERARSHLISSL